MSETATASATTATATATETATATATAMNAAAEPFVPKAGDTSTAKPEQGATDVAGVESDTGGMSGTQIWRPQYKGRVRSFSDQKGFGFIDCADTMRQFGRDVFIHRFQMAENDLKVGQEVIFEVELNKTGQPQGRRVRANEEAMPWDYSQQMGGWNGMGYGGNGMGAMGGMYGNYGMDTTNYYHQTRERFPVHDPSTTGDAGGPPEQIEEMLRGCSGSSDMWEIIEQYGQHFGKKHVVTALYQLGLCRQYEKRSAEVNLTSALVDRLVLFPPAELTADEASRVLWALAVLEEVSGHTQARQFAMDLGKQAAKRFSEFTPAQMAGFVSSLSRLVRSPEEDKLVGKITEQFSDYALGGTGALPRFAPHELTSWTNFLKDAANAQNQPQQQPYPNPFMPPMPGKGGGPPYGQPGSYAGPGPGPGMMGPFGPQMGKGMPSGMQMPPMGKGGSPPGWHQQGPPSGGKDPYGKDSHGKDPHGKGAYGPGPLDGKGPGGPGGKPGADFGGMSGMKGMPSYPMGGKGMEGLKGRGPGMDMDMMKGALNSMGSGGKGASNSKGSMGAYPMTVGGKGPGDDMGKGGYGGKPMNMGGSQMGGPGPGPQGRAGPPNHFGPGGAGPRPPMGPGPVPRQQARNH